MKMVKHEGRALNKNIMRIPVNVFLLPLIDNYGSCSTIVYSNSNYRLYR